MEFVIMVSARVKLDTRVTRARIQHRARMDVRRMEYAFVGCAPALKDGAVKIAVCSWVASHAQQTQRRRRRLAVDMVCASTGSAFATLRSRERIAKLLSSVLGTAEMDPRE